MASVAELEAGLISGRTKTALAAAKARGVKLRKPSPPQLRGLLTMENYYNNEALVPIFWMPDPDVPSDDLGRDSCGTA